MLSLVVCSANSEYLTNLRINVAETIGCDFEILSYPNEQGEKGICEVYNQGTKEASFEIVCFMHEDIKFLTQDWGKIVWKLFAENPALGLLGVAGGDYKSLAPSSWFNFEAPTEFPGKKYINIVQGYKSRDKQPVHEINNPKGKKLSQVACVDGVWMCTRKSIAQEVLFDQELLKGFHGYDIDYSIAVGQKHMVGVTFEVLLHHFSQGGSTAEWVADQIKIHNKWSSRLPINLTGAPLKECFRYEKYYFRNFLMYAHGLGFNRGQLAKVVQAAKQSPAMTTLMYLKLLWFVRKIRRRSM